MKHILLPIAWLAVATGASAQIAVGHIVDPSGSSVESTELVVHTAFGSLEGRPLVVKTEVGTGDELRSAVEGVLVTLACPNGAEITPESPFRLVMVPSAEGRECFVQLLSGTAHVQGDTATGLGAGDVELGARRTQYTLTLVPRGRTVVRDVQVFEGEVAVRDRADSVRLVSAGAALLVSGNRYVSRAISPREIGVAATAYARVDASRVEPQQREAAYPELVRAHTAVLTAPSDDDARGALLDAKLKYKVIGQGDLYHLDHMQPATTGSDPSSVRNQLLATAVYQDLGRTQEAAVLSTELRRVDPAILEQTIQQYRLTPELRARVSAGGAGDVSPDASYVSNRSLIGAARLTLSRGAVRVAAAADPARVAAGERSTIVVKVTDPSGAAIVGAAVTITAGGGAFEEGGTTATARSDAQGVVTSTWSCRPCAPSYELEVRAVADGYDAGQTTVRITVR